MEKQRAHDHDGTEQSRFRPAFDGGYGETEQGYVDA
jgi:hypothetical protein